MGIDVNSLFFVTIYVEALLGLLLLFIWLQNTRNRAVLWWGSAHLCRVASVSLFGQFGTAPDILTIEFANVVLLSSYALLWTGARVFSGRPLQPLYLLGGPVVWILATRVPFVADSMELKFLLTAGIIASYIWGAGYELWRGREERILSRWPAIIVLFVQGSIFQLQTPLWQALPWRSSDQLFNSVWLNVLSIEVLMFTIAIAFILVAMVKEYAELHHRTAALVDPLTGVVNRRGFLEEVASLDVENSENRPVTLLMADLDHFKSINDQFGHTVGDRVLQIFAAAASAKLGPQDVIGRLGGEEFAILLNGAGREKGLAVAERIRLSFESAAARINGAKAESTVSIGMVSARLGSIDIRALIDRADEALYCAKERGRNRVEVAAFRAAAAPGAA
jgi:diguanylate cyclase (GGDEF)-like protein